ncbi:MAG: serine/threonine protein kinase [Gammaproteobacteria bacterium]|nr:serine/threonine protein kinase [Gammaproteobacteria bacterium]
MADSRLLKKDLFGEIRRISTDGETTIVRDVSSAVFWLRCIARQLLRREARALAMLEGIEGVPQLVRVEHSCLSRSYLSGEPMYLAKPGNPDFFRAASKLLRTLHRVGVVHNDLAKEANILVRENGRPAFLDFQIAWYSNRRSRLFRLFAYEDLRHLLKHKRSYCPQDLTRRELAILANPSLPSRAYMSAIKPVYMFVTRRILGWSDREGAADRGKRQ